MNHPFVIKYKDKFVYKGEKACIVTELVNGGDLGSLITKRLNSSALTTTLFTEEEIMNYFIMILIGLDYLHS